MIPYLLYSQENHLKIESCGFNSRNKFKLLFTQKKIHQPFFNLGGLLLYDPMT
jgi:hypothetical protein